MGILLFADGGFEGDGLLRDFHHLADLADGHVHGVGDFLAGGLPAQLLHQLALGADELVDGLDHVHGDADGAGLVRDGAGDGLADPPGGIGREFEAAAVLELVHGLHEADVALLDQVQELQATVGVALGDADHEAQVGLDELGLGAAADALGTLEPVEVLMEDLARGFELGKEIGQRLLDVGQFLFVPVLQLGEGGILEPVPQFAALAFPGHHLAMLMGDLVDQPRDGEAVEAQLADLAG